jgi:aldehyde:ferredoxin oxidoreductase
MPYSYNGRILRVNLTERKTKVEKLSETFYRRFLGGRTLALYYLLREMKPGIDPYSPDNKLIFALSIITGISVPGTAKYLVAAKSPQTGGYGEAEAGGFWGPELKFAGYDAIIIDGKADEPVYLWIHDGECEFKDASHLWGKSTGEAQKIIREELQDGLIRIAQIGPAGENLVRYACIINELKYANGRCGLGAVMGSKNLKAIAVRGHKKIEPYNPQVLQRLAKFFAENIKNNVDALARQEFGTSNYFLNANFAGTLVTRNFHKGAFEYAEEVSGEKLHEKMVIGNEGCYACPNRCKRLVKLEKPYEVDPSYGGPEYETMAAFGSNCEVSSLEVIVKANELCNKYGLDTISTGSVIAFAMECYENGILTEKDTNGLELKFGNANAIIPLIEMIAFRQGLGNILAEGVAKAAEKIGKGAEKFAMHVKGKEVPMHEPRGKFGVALAYALSPIGADHLQHEHDGAFDPELTGYSHKAEALSFFIKQARPLGILEPVPSLDLGPKKVRLFTYLQYWWSLFNSLGLCIFAWAPVRIFKVNQLTELVNAATGWDMTLWELMKVGERGITMARAFNIREGLDKKDDKLPERFFEPLESGRLKGLKVPKSDFEKALITYYEMMGWDYNGVPTLGKLEELDVGWIAKELKKN